VKPSSPAVVSKVLKEEEINTLTLTPEAEERLGIRTVLAEHKPVRRIRTYGGEVTIPAGHTIPVAAPLGGTLKAPPGGVPPPGRPVRKGQPIVVLLPLLSPEAQTTLVSASVEADGQLNNARTQLEAARIALDRAKRLLKDQAGSKKNVDDCQAQCDLAQKTLDAALARRDLLSRVAAEAERGTANPIALSAPEHGLLRTVSALPGQNVPAGAALFEVVDVDKVWIRVPVYVGDLPSIAGDAEAMVGDLAMRPGGAQRSARPVVAPPSANPLAATADIYYELDNRQAGLAPGQRVGVALPIKGEDKGLTVPWSAVVIDIHGGTWVYEQMAPHVFLRRRTTIRYVVGDQAIVASGLKPGVPVVVSGAAELFGTEVGFSK
jgi:RND family efflux transporter MFP subunit